MVKKRSKKARFAADPHAEREASKYESPIPSREFILSLLKDSNRLMTREDLNAACSLVEEDDIEAMLLLDLRPPPHEPSPGD